MVLAVVCERYSRDVEILGLTVGRVLLITRRKYKSFSKQKLASYWISLEQGADCPLAKTPEGIQGNWKVKSAKVLHEGNMSGRGVERGIRGRMHDVVKKE